MMEPLFAVAMNSHARKGVMVTRDGVETLRKALVKRLSAKVQKQC